MKVSSGSSPNLRVSKGIRAAAAIAVLYAVLLLIFGALVVKVELTPGSPAQWAFSQSPRAGVGLIVLPGFILLGAAALLVGARRATKGLGCGLLVAPFALIFVFGTVGEIVDIVGTATPGSDAIGALILLGAGLPLWLARSAFAEWARRLRQVQWFGKSSAK